MSRIGKNPIPIPRGRHGDREEQYGHGEGPEGRARLASSRTDIGVNRTDGTVTVGVRRTRRSHKSLHGLSRTLVANMVEGVTKGYQKQLEITGVGYKAEVRPYGLQLALGFSHHDRVQGADGHQALGAAADAGRDRRRGQAVVGQVAAEIRVAASARAVQGQGHQVRRRSDSPKGRQGGRQVIRCQRFQRRARAAAHRRHIRVRKKVTGTPERPRLVVFRSLKHIYAQLVDDVARRTLVTVSSTEIESGKKTEKSVAGGEEDRREGEGRGHHEGRLRPRWVPVSRPREGGGRRSPRGRAGVLTYGTNARFRRRGLERPRRA